MMRKVSVPTIFLDDHVSRDLAFIVEENVDPKTPRAIWLWRGGPKTTTITASIETLRELLSDAVYYSNFEVERDDDHLRSIVGSARSTVKSLDRQVPYLFEIVEGRGL
jgi:hypothetical protein